ncbi:urease accessory protein UreD [Jannaschia pagri]|uniref:Urease accessory protein UreD n=2 Tax=Jannaschia pagri TaxID=2829797 RepID=A0ABQ4NMS4_9RHOB|nr:urease accessory protein UreD [Jannaschia sp. AI_61]GIT91855.1 urease accessory protein UreD [Jannaschia sp. AI_61]GIT95689.1 urease accessory protein UreD [Jannaschia sp. AI_62]
MQRVHGAASVRLTRAGLSDLRQQGSAKALLPRTDDPAPEVVFLNTAGGVTGGDRLDYTLTLGAGAMATGATQTAERAYRATGETPGVVATTIKVGADARLDWLPQEVIVFDGAHLRRETEIDLSPGATVLSVDALVLGRVAHGEKVTSARVDDVRTVRQGGRLMHQEHVTLSPEALGSLDAFGDHRAFATVVFIGPGACDALGPLRAALPTDGPVRAQASAWDGRLVARFAASTLAPLRRALIRAILPLRGRPVPRVWQSDV